MASFDPNPLKELLLDEGASLMPYGIEAPEPGTVRAEPAEPSPDVPLLAAAFGPIDESHRNHRVELVRRFGPPMQIVQRKPWNAIQNATHRFFVLHAERRAVFEGRKLTLVDAQQAQQFPGMCEPACRQVADLFLLVRPRQLANIECLRCC